MSLTVGTTLHPPPLPGRWSVWSKAAETPGGHFLVPADDEARALGAKYAVVKVTQPKNTVTPLITLIRTDPHIEGLTDD